MEGQQDMVTLLGNINFNYFKSCVTPMNIPPQSQFMNRFCLSTINLVDPSLNFRLIESLQRSQSNCRTIGKLLVWICLAGSFPLRFTKHLVFHREDIIFVIHTVLIAAPRSLKAKYRPLACPCMVYTPWSMVCNRRRPETEQGRRLKGVPFTRRDVLRKRYWDGTCSWNRPSCKTMTCS